MKCSKRKDLKLQTNWTVNYIKLQYSCIMITGYIRIKGGASFAYT